jgi:hypothetical protein
MTAVASGRVRNHSMLKHSSRPGLLLETLNANGIAREVVAVILIALVSQVQVARPALPELVGSWKIVSYEDGDAASALRYSRAGRFVRWCTSLIVGCRRWQVPPTLPVAHETLRRLGSGYRIVARVTRPRPASLV